MMSVVARRMPAERDPHERTLIAWPARESLWGEQLDRAKDCYANVIRTVARFEPVMVIANCGAAAEAEAAVGRDHPHAVAVVEELIDDSWIRDNGPTFVRESSGTLTGVDFRFNGYGEKYVPFHHDDALPARLCEALGIDRRTSGLVLEGGSIAVDGAGTLVTTQQCLLHPMRNARLSPRMIEDALLVLLGAERVIWLERGLVEDRDTDGHVDNLCAFVAPGVALVQGVADTDNPNAAILADNRARLDAAGIETITVDVLPYDHVGGREVVVPPLNLYFVNGGVLVPVADGDPASADAAVTAITAAIPDREIVAIPASVLAYGGGGVHCITQQVPAVPQVPA